MGNVLKMEKQQQIKVLLDLGWSYRAIEKTTGIRRETVSKYDNSKAAKVPTDKISNTTDNHPKNRSTACKYDREIKEGLQKNLTARRIYQDLKIDLQADISYDAVKRYARTLKKKNPKVFARLHSLPGREAQVDFGQGAPTLKGNK